MLTKISQHGLKIDPAEILVCSTFREIDDLYTAPIHGFKDAIDYWTRANSKPWLKHFRVPTLLINARNDPFLPASSLPSPGEVSETVSFEFPETAGHVGFVSGGIPGSLDWLPQRIMRFFTTIWTIQLPREEKPVRNLLVINSITPSHDLFRL